jgi:hypothetical protein
VAVTVDQIRDVLAQPGGASGVRRSMALDTIVGDFSRYHVALAVQAGAVAAGSVVVGLTVVAMVSRRARSSAMVSSARARRMPWALGVSSIALALLMMLVTAANISNATTPERGLRIFFDGA